MKEYVVRYEPGQTLRDLRGHEVREVHRNDVVIITGAEYLRKSRLAKQAEDIEWLAEQERKKLPPQMR